MATPVFCCGFECGNGHHTLTGSSSIVTSGMRSGLRALQINPTASTGYAISLDFGVAINVMRVYIYFVSLPTSTCEIAVFGTTTSIGGAYFNISDNSIYAGASATPSLGATGVPVTTGVWYKLDIKGNTASNPWLIDVSVNGTACGQKSYATGGSSKTQYTIGNRNLSSTFDAIYDDILLSSTLADYPLPGALKIEPFVPTSDGTHNIAGTADFRKTLTATDILNSTTDAYLLVDNIPLDSGAAASNGTFINMIAPPNATDYVECVFGPAPGISTPTTAPRSVEVIAAIAQAGTGAGNMRIRLNDNGTLDDMYSATGVAGVTSYAYKRKHYAAGPAGAWVIGGGGNGDFTDLRVRYGSPAAVDANPDQYFSSTMIEAEFAEVAAAGGFGGYGMSMMGCGAL